VKSVIMNKPFVVVPFFKAFGNIARPEDCWLYLETVLPEYLFEETWYNGDPISKEEQNAVLQVNHLVQAPRMRQVRVKPYKCADGPGGLTNAFRAIPERLKQYLINCYPDASGAQADHDEELPGWPRGITTKYRSGAELASEFYSTQYEVYEGGGWAIDIPLNTSQAEVKEMMHYLMENKWTDQSTRAIFFDFVTYHPYQRFYLSVRLCFEFLHIGEIVPTESFRVMRLGFIDNSQYFAVTFDVLCHLLVIRCVGTKRPPNLTNVSVFGLESGQNALARGNEPGQKNLECASDPLVNLLKVGQTRIRGFLALLSRLVPRFVLARA
jgi:hypothetical protein